MQHTGTALAVALVLLVVNAGSVSGQLSQAETTQQQSCLTEQYIPSLCTLLTGPRTFPVADSDFLYGSYNVDEAWYAALCYHEHLSLGDDDTRSCLRLALSVLATEPRHGMLLLIPNNAVVDEDYQRVADRIGLRLHRFIDFERNLYYKSKSAKHDKWTQMLNHRFGKLQAWNLPYKRVVLIDADSVVLLNLDHLMLSPDSMGSNCWFHARHDQPGATKHFRWTGMDPKVTDTDAHNFWLRRIRLNAGIMVLTPGQDKYLALQGHLQEMLDQNNGTWTRWLADQPLLTAQTTIRFGMLPCTYQGYPDICQFRPSWIFPKVRAIHVFHYTYFFDHSKGIKLPAVQFDANRPDTDEGHCWNLFGSAITLLDGVIDRLKVSAGVQGVPAVQGMPSAH